MPERRQWTGIQTDARRATDGKRGCQTKRGRGGNGIHTGDELHESARRLATPLEEPADERTADGELDQNTASTSGA